MEFKKMTQRDALEIASWHYEGIYRFYDMESDKEDMALFIDEEERKDQYFSVFKNQELIGYFDYELEEDTVVIGLALKPEYTGVGFGKEFINAGIEFAKEHFSIKKITLSVATFNERAIKVYQSVGFNPVHTYMQKTNGSEYEFLRMELDV